MPRLIIEQEVTFNASDIKIEDGGQAAIADHLELTGGHPEFFIRLHSWAEAERGTPYHGKQAFFDAHHKLLKSMAGRRLRIRIEDLGEIEG
jgi:hypothetical protein